MLGLTGGLDASLDETAGLGDVAGGEACGALLVLGVGSCDGAGELAAGEQDAMSEGAWLNVVVVPIAP